MSCAILMYHRVANLSPDTHALCTPPKRFVDQLTRLQSHCAVWPLAELCEQAAGGDPPESAVAITFDDGTADSLVAARLLVERSLPATFFVTTDRLDQPHEAWWDTLERLLVEPGELPGRLELAGEVLATGSPGERLAAHQRLRELLMPLSAAERDVMMESLIAWSGRALLPRDSHRLMLRDEVAALARLPGCSVGAHSVSHLQLPLRPPAEQQAEVESCRDQLARATGTAIDAFAYPFGAFADQTVEVVQRAGYRYAVTVAERALAAGEDRLRMPRVSAPPVEGDQFSLFLAQLLGSGR